MPCTTTGNAKHDGVAPVNIKTWLMDTGTPLDLVNQASVAPHTACITPCKPIILDTANGETKIDRSIDLRVGRLGERIAPYIMDGPNVLSLGRRVIKDG